MTSAWKGVIGWYFFSTGIFINLNLSGETVILASESFKTTETHEMGNSQLNFSSWY